MRVVEGATLEIERDEPNGSMPRAARQRESRVPRDGHGYSWLEDYLVRLEGKEARGEYYVSLE
jgi:hypothetical protein